MGELWSGVFEAYGIPGIVRGQFKVTLYEQQSEYETDYTLVYKGMYRYGTVLKGRIAVTITGCHIQVTEHQSVTFKFDSQIPNKKTGTYATVGPSSSGTFMMIKGELPKEGGCNVM